VSIPRDPVLPRLHLLLDADAMAPVLGRSLGRPARVSDVRLARVSYKPGERVSVHYAVQVDGRREDAVARAVAGHDLATRIREPRYVELARRVDGRSPAVTPAVHDPQARALVTWLPFDPRLPALALRLGEQPRLLSYRPGRRAVLRLGERVLKAYGSAAQYEAAARALRAGSALPELATPRSGAMLPRVRLTTQAAIEGTPVSPLDAAEEAGALLRRLRRAEPGALPAVPRERPLEVAARKAELIAAVVPPLADRVATLVRRLGSEQPPRPRPLPAHGDFHAGQLLRVDGELVVVDLDGLCLADPALDLAEYAAAEPGDVLEALLEGYGARPAGLDWHLAVAGLIRASHPFHLQLPEWPDRVEAMVARVEAILARRAR
jgi:Phosphotransferase enzyme family